MARDATGVSHMNVLEELVATDGTRYNVVGGTGNKTRYRGSDGTSIEVDSRRRTGDELQDVIRFRAEYPAVYGR